MIDARVKCTCMNRCNTRTPLRPLSRFPRRGIQFDRRARQFRNANWKFGGRLVGMLARCDKLQEGGPALLPVPALKVVASLSFRLIERPRTAVEDSLGCVGT